MADVGDFTDVVPFRARRNTPLDAQFPDVPLTGARFDPPNERKSVFLEFGSGSGPAEVPPAVGY